MTSTDLARVQFAFTSINHFLFVPVTIGLAFLTALLQTAWHRSGRAEYLRLTRFFGILLVINIAIESLPLRWDTPVGTHGAAPSGGQRQRLAVARALLADPDLLILDEPTAHLDPGTRRALLSDLLAATAGRTMLLITHDLDGIDELDQVITLEGGKIVEPVRGPR